MLVFTKSAIIDSKLEQIKKLLFPALEIDEVTDEDGKTIKFHTDRSIDSLLEAVKQELVDGLLDATLHGTIDNAIARLIEVRKILGVVPALDLDAEYLRVEPLEIGQRTEDIA